MRKDELIIPVGNRQVINLQAPAPTENGKAGSKRRDNWLNCCGQSNSCTLIGLLEYAIQAHKNDRL
jgi:hypothetical protein